MGLRVIAGRAKGRKLSLVPGAGTRPVQDKVKQALFNIIGPDIEGARFLDLFAGTGSVGIEALSRGAAAAVFLDTHPAAVRTIEANLARTGLRDRAQVLRREALAYLRQERPEPFDYVYVAPPQYQGLWREAVLLLDRRPEVLHPDAWVIAQMHPREYQELALARLEVFDRRRYGNTLLAFYRLPGA